VGVQESFNSDDGGWNIETKMTTIIIRKIIIRKSALPAMMI